MDPNRSRYGLLVSALGTIVLAVSVFLPWYGVSFTAGGIALVQGFGGKAAARVADAGLQGHLTGLHVGLGSLERQQVVAVTARHALQNMNVALLAIAALALLLTLIPLVASSSLLSDLGGEPIALLGVLATGCVVYRMVQPPTPEGQLLALSLREGAWLALLGSLAMVVGGLWPRSIRAPTVAEDTMRAAWAGLDRRAHGR
jgi:hypothetical protein